MSKIFHRSEHEHALNLARKARRRGNATQAELWLKHADRHLATEARFRAAIENARRRYEEQDAEAARKKAEQEDERSASLWRRFEDELDAIDAAEAKAAARTQAIDNQ